jgi:hypothetical protein
LMSEPPAVTNFVPSTSTGTRTPSPQNDSPSPRSAPAHPALALGNAADQSGKTLQAPPSASISKRDPWAAPAPAGPADRVITPGATVKLRGSGV